MSRSNALFSADANSELNTPRLHGPVKPHSVNYKTSSIKEPLLVKSTRNVQKLVITPGSAGPMKGIGVKTSAHPKAPSFAVFTDTSTKLDISEDEKEDCGPVEKTGKTDDHTDYWDARLVLDPKYDNVTLTEETEDCGPVEKLGIADEHTTYWDARFIIDPKYENIVLTEESEELSHPSGLFLKYNMTTFSESDEFDLDAFNQEYADVLDNLRNDYWDL